MINKLTYKIVVFLSVWFLPLVSFAQPSGGSVDTPTLDNPITSNNIDELLVKILDIMMTIGLPIIIFFFIFSGFKFVLARGNPTKLEDAKRAFMWTVVGAAILLGAKVLASVIQGTVDIF